MTDMKDDAQALFDIARSAHEPTSREHERVLRGVLARGAIAAGVTSASVGSAAAKGLLATSRIASTLKIIAGFAIVGAAGAGAYRVSTAVRAPSAVHPSLPSPGKQAAAQKLTRPPEPLPAVVSVPTPEQRADAPELLKPRAPSSPGASVVERAEHDATETRPPRNDHALEPSPAASPALAAAPAASQSFPTNAPPSTTASQPAGTVTLTREARALADVQRALREGRSADALVMLAAQNREFAGGVLGQEREAARIMALCGAGRGAEGRAAAERFLTANPGSPVATHIRSSCSML